MPLTFGTVRVRFLAVPPMTILRSAELFVVLVSASFFDGLARTWM